jgi:hypothetical protein
MINFDKINTLKQVRRTFKNDGISALADNICYLGILIDPVTIVSFGPKRCQEYIDLANKYFKANHKIEELKMTSNKQYWIMLSGERRLRAHHLIWNEGCSMCREKYGKEDPGACFKRHFHRDKTIKAHLWTNLSPLDAIDFQLSGNSYEPVLEAEMMETMACHFQVKREKNPKLTIVDFAKSVGRNPGTISDYLKIFELPPEVLEFFRKDIISAGIAREIAFLKDNDEKDLMYWVRRAALSKGLSIDKFKKTTRQHLANRKQTMIQIFTTEAEKVEKERSIRQAAAKEMLDGVWAFIAYWKKVIRLLKEGKIGKEDSFFSAKSPIHIYREQIKLMQDQVLPHLLDFLPKKVVKDIEETFITLDIALPKVEDVAE